MASFASEVEKVSLNVTPAATGHGTAATTGSELDMAGFNAVSFTCVIGNSTSAITMTITGASASSGTFQAIGSATASSSAGDTNRLMVVDLLRPTFRYLRTTLLSTGVANVAAVIARQYHAAAHPTSNSSDVSLAKITFGATS